MSHLQASIMIPAPVSEVFAYVSDLENLKADLSGRVDVDTLVVPVEIRPGSQCQLEMSRYGVTQVVKLEIEEFQRNQKIRLRLVEGIFRQWRHTIKFESRGAETYLAEFVEYRLPFGLLGHLVDDLFAHRNLQELIEYRLAHIRSYFSQETGS